MEKLHLKFAANVSMLFKECSSVAERIVKAKEAGFLSVEITVPYVEEKEKIAQALTETGLQCVFINSWPGPGNEGIATKPDRVEDFKKTLELSVEYAKAFHCPRMHILAGCIEPQFTLQEIKDVYVKNVCYAADRLAKVKLYYYALETDMMENMTGLIEFVNSTHTLPNYFVDTPEKALELIQEINRPNILLQMDLFHLQIVKGDLTYNIKELLPKTGYIQISQVPGRGEPDSLGEINYAYIFNLLHKLKYNGWIGTEYNPSGDTMKGLTWFEQFKAKSTN